MNKIASIDNKNKMRNSYRWIRKCYC